MPVTICPECGGKVSTNAAQCPHCGLDHDTILAHYTAERTYRKHRTIGIILLAMSALFIVLGLSTTWYGICHICGRHYNWIRSEFGDIVYALLLSFICALAGGWLVGRTRSRRLIFSSLSTSAVLVCSALIWYFSHDDIHDPTSRYYVKNVIFNANCPKMEGTHWSTRCDGETMYVMFTNDSVFIKSGKLLFKDKYTPVDNSKYVYLGKDKFDTHFPQISGYNVGYEPSVDFLWSNTFAPMQLYPTLPDTSIVNEIKAEVGSPLDDGMIHQFTAHYYSERYEYRGVLLDIITAADASFCVFRNRDNHYFSAILHGNETRDSMIFSDNLRRISFDKIRGQGTFSGSDFSYSLFLD